MNKGKFARNEDRNRTIRAIYQNLREELTADAAIKRLQEQYGYTYLSPDTLRRIVGTDHDRKL